MSTMGAMRPDVRKRTGTILAAVISVALGGCSSVGPGSVVRDRADYIGAIAKSWKEQMLANIVRLRYGDAPVFVDVSSVISSYSLQTQVLASGGKILDAPGSIVNLGANATYLDKPTITYTPLTGDQFTRVFCGRSRRPPSFRCFRLGTRPISCSR